MLQLFKVFRFHDEDTNKILPMNGYKAENPYFQFAEYSDFSNNLLKIRGYVVQVPQLS